MTQDSSNAAASTPLPGIGDLLGRGWKIYRSRPLRFIALTIIGIIATLLVTAVVLVIGIVIHEKYQYSVSFLQGRIFGYMVLTLTAIVYFAGTAFSLFALLAAISDENATVGAALKAGLRKTFPGLWLIIASSLLITGGSLLFIVPGIVLAVWFAFGLIIVAAGEAGGLNALLRSKAAVRGHWFPVFGRLFVLSFLASVLSASVIGILLLPWLLISFSLIYQDLKERTADLPVMSPASAKLKFVGFAAAGYVAAIVLVMFIVRSHQQPVYVSQQYVPIQPSVPQSGTMIVTAPLVEVFDSEKADAQSIGTIPRAEQVVVIEKGESRYKVRYSTPNGEGDLVGWVDAVGMSYPDTGQESAIPSIVGSWCGQNEQPGNGCYSFLADGTLNIECPMCFHGTWTQQGDTISISLDSPELSPDGGRLEPISYSGTMTMQSNNNSMVADFPQGDGSGHNQGGTWMVYRQIGH